MADLSPARVQALKDRPLRDFGYGFVGVSMSMDERDDLLAALEAHGQTIARLVQAKDAELARLTAERDAARSQFDRHVEWTRQLWVEVNEEIMRASKRRPRISRAEPAERRWRPIETAPLTGQRVLVWDGLVQRIGAFIHGKWFVDGGLELALGFPPTRWHLLPDPPVVADAPKETT